MVEGSISNEVSKRELLVRLWRQPVDACYELVGRVRRHGKGFSGADEAWSEIETFFATVRRRGTVETTGEIG